MINHNQQITKNNGFTTCDQHTDCREDDAGAICGYIALSHTQLGQANAYDYEEGG